MEICFQRTLLHSNIKVGIANPNLRNTLIFKNVQMFQLLGKDRKKQDDLKDDEFGMITAYFCLLCIRNMNPESFLSNFWGSYHFDGIYFKIVSIMSS